MLVMREGLAQTIEEAIRMQAAKPQENVVSTGAASVSEKEYKELKDENARLKYRVKILLNTLAEAEQRHSK